MKVDLIRIVVASPSDVQDERKALERVVKRLNRVVSVRVDPELRLEVVGWEDAYPGFHPEGPQGLIDTFLRINESDFLVGIFWKRFGTPVKDAKSGTEKEILTAYKAWKKKRHPQIMIYFNQQPFMPGTTEEAEQMVQVQKFKEEFPEEGLLWKYTGWEEFEKEVYDHLMQQILIRVASKTKEWDSASKTEEEESTYMELRRRGDMSNLDWQKIFAVAQRRILLLGHCMKKTVDRNYTGLILRDRLLSGVEIRLVVLDPDDDKRGGQLQEINKQHTDTNLKKRIERTRKLVGLMNKAVKEEWEQRQSEDSENATRLQEPRISLRYTSYIIHSSIVIVDDHYLITPYSHLDEAGDNGLVVDIQPDTDNNKAICAKLEDEFEWHYENAQER